MKMTTFENNYPTKCTTQMTQANDNGCEMEWENEFPIETTCEMEWMDDFESYNQMVVDKKVKTKTTKTIQKKTIQYPYTWKYETMRMRKDLLQVQQMAQLVKLTKSKVPKSAKPRQFIRESKIKMFIKKITFEVPHTLNSKERHEQIFNNLNLQWGMPKVSLDVITQTIISKFNESEVGKKLSYAIMAMIVNSTISIIALIYNICTNSSKAANVLSSIAVVTNIVALVVCIYAYLKMQKLTTVAVDTLDMTEFVTKQMKALTERLMTDDHVDDIHPMRHVDLKNEQSVGDLVDKMSETARNLDLKNSEHDITGIKITSVKVDRGMQENSKYITDNLVKSKSLHQYIWCLVNPYLELIPASKVSGVFTDPDYKPSKTESFSDLVTRLLGADDLKDRINRFINSRATMEQGMTVYEKTQFRQIPDVSVDSFFGDITLARAQWLAIMTGTTLIYFNKNTSGVPECMVKFGITPLKQYKEKELVLYVSEEGNVSVEPLTVEWDKGNLYVHTKRVIDVLSNLKLDSAIESGDIDYIDACRQYVQQKYNSYETFFVDKIQSLDFNMKITRCIKIGVVLLATCIGATEFFGKDAEGKSMLKRFGHMRTAKKNVQEAAEEMIDLTNDVLWEMFGISISPTTAAYSNFLESYETLVDLNSKNVIYYVNNLDKYFELKQIILNVEKDLHSMNSKSKDMTTGLTELTKSIRAQIVNGRQLLTKVFKTLSQSTSRVLTDAACIFGAKGAGKSFYITNKLLPAIAEAQNESLRVYNVNFGENRYFPQYLGQHYGFYDEFLAMMGEDPIIAYMNGLHSVTPFNMEGAFDKEQPCALKLMMYAANQPYVSLRKSLSEGAEEGFYSRIYGVHFVNVRQTRDMKRAAIPRCDFNDPKTYELREYVTDINYEHTYPMFDKETLNKSKGYDGAKDEYDNTLYTETSTKLKYRLVTHKQLVAKIVKRLEYNATQGIAMRKRDLQQAVKTTIKNCISTPSIKEICEKTSMYGNETEVREAFIDIRAQLLNKDPTLTAEQKTELLKREKITDEGLSIQSGSMSLDHVVVCLLGLPGCGKSTTATDIGNDIGRMIQAPVYEFKEKLDASVVTYPGVVILHDQCYRELEYINFYDAIPKPCLILNTSNCTVEPAVVPADQVNSQLNAVSFEASNDVSDSFFQRTMQNTVGWLLKSKSWPVLKLHNPTVTNEVDQQPGWARRMGVPGALWYGGTMQRRPLITGMLIKSTVGYRLFKSGEKDVEVKKSTLLDEILLMYQTYIKKHSEIEIKYIPKAEADTLIPGEIDVVIKSKDLQSLIKLTRNTGALTSAALSGAFGSFTTGGDVVAISKRVRHSKFPFQPTEYAINKDATIEEASEIGKKMYRQLMYGSSEFNVKVSCDEFTILGYQGKIHVCLNTVIPENRLEMTDDDGTLVVRRITNVNGEVQEKIIYTMTYDQFAMLRARGVDYVELRQEMNYIDAQEFARYVRSVDVPDNALPAVEKYYFKIKTATNYIEDKIKFQERVAQVTQTYIWTFLLGLISVFACVFVVTALVEYFKSTKTTEIETTYKEEDEEYEVWITFDKTSKSIIVKVNANVDAITIDRLIEDVKSEIRQTIKEDLNDDDDYEWTVQAGDNMSSYPQRKDTSHKPKKSLKINKIQSKGGLYNNEEGVVKKKPLNLTTIKVQEGQMDIIVNKVFKQMYKVTNLSKCRTVMAVGWKGRLLLTSAHIMHDVTDTFVITNVTTGKTYMAEPLAKLEGHDLLIMKIPESEKRFEAHKDITNYFQDQATQRMYQEVLFRKIKQHALCSGDETITHLHTSDSIGVCTPIDMAAPYKKGNFELDVDCYNFVTYHKYSGPRTEDGDCGTPLFGIRKDTAVLIGFHFGTSSRAQLATSVTKEMLKEIAETIEGDVFYDCGDVRVQSAKVQTNGSALTMEMFEYTGPAGEECKVLLPSFTYDLITEAMETEDNDDLYFDCMNGKHTKVLGTTKQGKMSRRMKPKYVPTPYSDEVAKYIPIATGNAVVNPAKVEDPSGLVTSRTGKHSILMTQMNKFNNEPTSPLEVRQGYIKRSLDILRLKYSNWYGKTGQRDLTLLETINGLTVNPRDIMFGCLEMINKDGAVGIDMQRQFNVTQIGDVLTESGIKGPTGKPLLTFKDNKAGNYIKDLTLNTVVSWAKGQRCEGIVQDNVKPELLKLSKLITGTSRGFESYPLHVTLATRMITGRINAAMKYMHLTAHGQIGIDRTDFTELYNRFSCVGHFGEHGDFSNWDKNVTKEEAYAAAELCYVMRYPYELPSEIDKDFTPGTPEYIERKEYYNQLRCIIDSICYSINLADGLIYVKNKGQNSGCNITTTLNCQVNDLRRIGVILYLVDEHNENCSKPDYYETKVKQLSGYKNSEVALRSLEANKNAVAYPVKASSVLKGTDWINCGDDKASVIATEWLWLLNFVTYSAAYEKVWGCTYGSPHKDGTIEIVTPLNQLNFVSRDFVYDDNNFIVKPTLKMISIDRLLHWTSNLDPAQLKANLDCVFNELMLYPKHVYDKYAKIVNTIINPYFEEYPGCETYIVPSQEEAYEEFVNLVRFKRGGTIVPTTRLSELSRENYNDLEVSRQPTVCGPLNITTVKEKFDPFEDLIIHSGKMDFDLPKINPEHFDKILKLFQGLDVTVSGQPAYNHVKKYWSTSCSVEKPTTWTTSRAREVLQQHFAKLKVTYLDHDVMTININGTQYPRVQIKIKNVPGVHVDPVQPVRKTQVFVEMEPQGLNDAVQNNTTTAGSSVEEGSGKSILMNERDGTSGVSLQYSGTPLAGNAQFYKLSTFQKAHMWQKKTVIKVNAGATSNSPIFKLGYGDLINSYMKAAYYGDTAYSAMTVQVKVVNLTNSGMTGSCVVGLTETGTQAKSETDLNSATRKYIDLNMDSEHIFDLNLSSMTYYVYTRSTNPQLNMPYLQAIVLGDTQTTFDNKALYTQLHIYSRFKPGSVISYNLAEPSFEGGGGGVPTNEPLLSQILGEDAQIATDGQLSFTQTGRPRVNRQVLSKRAFATLVGEIDTPNEDNPEVSIEDKLDIKTTAVWRIISTDYKGKNDYSTNVSWTMKMKHGPGSSPYTIEADYEYKDGTLSLEYDSKDPQMVSVADLSVDAKSEEIDGQVNWGKWPNSAIDINRVNMIDSVLGEDFMYNIDMKTLSIDKDGYITNGLIKCDDSRRKQHAHCYSFRYLPGSQTWVEGEVSQGMMFESVYNIPETDLISVMGMRNIPESIPYLPENCARIITVQKGVKTPSVVGNQENFPTIFGTHNLAQKLAMYYDPTKIYEMTVVETIYNQVVFYLIYHGPSEVVFIKTSDKDYTPFALCKFPASELKITAVNEISTGAVLPTTNMSNGWLDRRAESYHTKVRRTRAVIALEPQAGLALGMIGGGLLQGIGQGMNSYFQYQQMLEMFEKNAELKKMLQETIGQQKMEQLTLELTKRAELERELLEERNRQQTEMQENQHQHEVVMQGLKTPAMQAQLSRSNAEEPIDWQPDVNTMLSGNMPGENRPMNAELMQDPDKMTFSDTSSNSSGSTATTVRAPESIPDLEFVQRPPVNVEYPISQDQAQSFLNGRGISTNEDVDPAFQKYVNERAAQALPRELIRDAENQSFNLGKGVTRYFYNSNNKPQIYDSTISVGRNGFSV